RSRLCIVRWLFARSPTSYALLLLAGSGAGLVVNQIAIYVYGALCQRVDIEMTHAAYMSGPAHPRPQHVIGQDLTHVAGELGGTVTQETSLAVFDDIRDARNVRTHDRNAQTLS